MTHFTSFYDKFMYHYIYTYKVLRNATRQSTTTTYESFMINASHLSRNAKLMGEQKQIHAVLIDETIANIIHGSWLLFMIKDDNMMMLQFIYIYIYIYLNIIKKYLGPSISDISPTKPHLVCSLLPSSHNPSPI